MQAPPTPSYEFEVICKEIFESLGYSVKTHLSTRSGNIVTEIDMVAERLGASPLFVEVKWTRESQISLRKMRDWCGRLSNHARFIQGRQFILIVSGYVNAIHLSWLEGEFAFEIWDRQILLAKTSHDSNLAERLIAFLSRFSGIMEPASNQNSNAKLPGIHDINLVDKKPSSQFFLPLGEVLTRKLEETDPGPKHARRYEILCMKIVDYLFGDSLLDAKEQSRTEDKLNVLDIVYRVSPSHKFWETLTRDFRARVVIFECKNYTGQIGPQQVYSTERYINVGALRSICFLLSRQPPHEHAELAAAGAMRETGKLLIFLSDADLVAMLKVRDAQLSKTANTSGPDNDPTILLDQKIYDFIARLPR